jgi:hypothetical protein
VVIGVKLWALVATAGPWLLLAFSPDMTSHHATFVNWALFLIALVWRRACSWAGS